MILKLISRHLFVMLSGIWCLSLTVQAQTKNQSVKFYESITFTQPVDYTTRITPLLKLFDLDGYNSESYLESLSKQNILKKQNGKYWFRIPLQEDFGDQVCYMLFDTTLYWFGGFKPFAWSKDGKDKREAEIVVWAEYEITPGKGYSKANSGLLDNTGITNIDMKDFYGLLNGAHLSFDKRKKPKR